MWKLSNTFMEIKYTQSIILLISFHRLLLFPKIHSSTRNTIYKQRCLQNYKRIKLIKIKIHRMDKKPVAPPPLTTCFGYTLLKIIELYLNSNLFMVSIYMHRTIQPVNKVKCIHLNNRFKLSLNFVPHVHLTVSLSKQ